MLDGITGILQNVRGLLKVGKLIWGGFKKAFSVFGSSRDEVKSNIQTKIDEYKGIKEDREKLTKMKQTALNRGDTKTADRYSAQLASMGGENAGDKAEKLQELLRILETNKKLRPEDAQARLNAISGYEGPLDQLKVGEASIAERPKNASTSEEKIAQQKTAMYQTLMRAKQLYDADTDPKKVMYEPPTDWKEFTGLFNSKYVQQAWREIFPRQAVGTRNYDGLNSEYKGEPFSVEGKPLANGGIVLPRPGGTRAIIGEAGRPEAVIPLDQIDKIFQRYNVKNEEKPKLQTILDSITKMRIELKNNSISVNPVPPTQIVQEKPQVQNVVNNTEKTNAPTTNNVYNITIPVKNGDPQVIEKVVRQVLYEREV
jgi:hypothetical protein